MTKLIQALPEGPLDIIGDVHGEIDALLRLLHRLGCTPAKRRAQRPLVFVGDLVDRGPNSPAVVELVMELVEAGIAQCVLGNHEYNLLTHAKKEGNGWARDDAEDYFQIKQGGQVIKVPFDSAMATPADMPRYRAFFSELPLALVRDDLRVVHACWHGETIERLPETAEIATLGRQEATAIYHDQVARGVYEKEQEERLRFGNLKDLAMRPTTPLPNHVQATLERQNGHGLRVLTSGQEEPVAFEDIFFVGGKWRFVRRSHWWLDYGDAPAVVIGHYWRQRGRHQVDPNGRSWQSLPPYAWAGPHRNVFCVDFSAGRRYQERAQGRRNGFDHGLAALRWPENCVYFDDREGVIQTTR
ncbi:MAG: metallophosphoesterase [Myxococcota bacterium]|nr:metallophosphoesterase [Myxococcota bacterium]